MSIIEHPNFKETKIVKIMVGDLTVPVETGTELSKLALVGKDIVINLIQDIKRDEESGEIIIPKQLLPWYKEVGKLYKDIHELTKGVQEKAMFKQMDFIKEIYKQAVKNKSPEELIKFIKDLENAKRNK